MQINVRHKHSARIPSRLTRCEICPELSEMTQREAIEVFTTMVNAGSSFQRALQAVFLSGMSAAREAMRDA